MPALTAAAMAPFDRFTLYDSPYVAHDHGCAIDLFPNDRDGPAGRSVTAPSPVAGRVESVHSVTAPAKPYAAEQDHLIVLSVATDGDDGVRTADETGGQSVGSERDGSATHQVRIMHVDPAVEAGDRVAIGDSLGRLVRSGFYAPWVDNHLHVGVRPAAADPVRASGSLALTVDVPVIALAWDGHGRVREVGETYAVLDAPTHPRPGEAWVGVAGGPGVVLDGGCPHYAGGGAHWSEERPDDATDRYTGPVAVADQRVGTAAARDVTWDAVAVRVNGRRVTGLSLVCGRDAAWGPKIIAPDTTLDLAVGDPVTVDVVSVDDPVRLG